MPDDGLPPAAPATPSSDPRRILLLTFSRRAAAEMTKRVDRIAGHVLGASAGTVTDALDSAEFKVG
jgi:superfamily I DNA/RNA helicase